MKPATASDARAWHLAWLAATGLAGLVLLVAFPSLRLTGALVALLLPAAAGAYLTSERRDQAGDIVLGVWALGVAAACALTGGIAGPWTVLCLVPVAAAGAIGGQRRLAEGAAAALAAAAAATLATLGGLARPAGGGREGMWLSLVGLALTALFLGAALLMERRRQNARERRRQADEARIAQVLASQPVLQVVIDATGAVRDLYGQAPEAVDAEALRSGGLAGLADERDRAALLEELAKAAREGEARLGFAPASALDRWLELDMRRLSGGDLVAVVRDATREHAREASLEQARQDAEAMAAGKSRFLANMSHELRTPLNAIIGFSDIMRAKMFGPLPGRYAEYVELIHESGGHLLDLINDVLDMSKVEAERYELSPEAFDARDPVTAALRLMRVAADRAGIQLRGVTPPRPLEVLADRRALKQIVLNLVSNALKFTPKDGSVTVMLRGDGEMLELSVADTGVGIAPEDLERLGRPYEQAGGADQKNKGTGLGLSLVRAFAELHGGTMTIESRLGEGAAVTVRLPVLQNAPSPPAPTPPIGPEAYGDNVVVFQPAR